jgi:hypothetical protein
MRRSLRTHGLPHARPTRSSREGESRHAGKAEVVVAVDLHGSHLRRVCDALFAVGCSFRAGSWPHIPRSAAPRQSSRVGAANATCSTGSSRLFARARAGALVVRGEPGVGKTVFTKLGIRSRNQLDTASCPATPAPRGRCGRAGHSARGRATTGHSRSAVAVRATVEHLRWGSRASRLESCYGPRKSREVLPSPSSNSRSDGNMGRSSSVRRYECY